MFLSYASQDAEAARKICDALSAAGVEVWFDQSELRGGDAWDQMIRRQIKECALFLPVISANTQARREGYFRREWKLAVDRTHDMDEALPFLLPVVVDDTTDAGAFVPEKFRDVHWTHLRGGETPPEFSARVKKLLAGETMGPGRSRPGERGSDFAKAATDRDGVASPKGFAPAPGRSVAVLAFANLSRDPENEYFSDGISEELLNLLARIPGMRVTARSSSFYFKGRNVPVPEIGRKLGVAYVVDGSVRRAGSRVRIVAQLIETTEGFHLWSETYDRELHDIFTLQDEVARDIVKNFHIRVGTAAERGPVNPEVHELVLRGRHAWNRFTAQGFVEAETIFGKALAIEPECAAAWSGLALVDCRRAIFRGVASRHQAAALAETEHRARQALQFDATLAEPHAVLGAMALMRGQLEEAGRAFRQALLINPNSEVALIYHARLLQRQGRPDLAEAELEEAERLSPMLFPFTGHLGLALLARRRHAQVIEVVNRAEALGMGSAWARGIVAVALNRIGRHGEAVTMARTALTTEARAGSILGHDALTDGIAAWALADAGERAQSETVVNRLRQEPAPCRYPAGFALAALGDRAAGFALLADIPQFMADHVLVFADQNKSVQADPHFTELLDKLDARPAFETHQKLLSA